MDVKLKVMSFLPELSATVQQVFFTKFAHAPSAAAICSVDGDVEATRLSFCPRLRTASKHVSLNIRINVRISRKKGMGLAVLCGKFPKTK